MVGQDLPGSKEQSWDSNPGPSGTTVFRYGSHLTLPGGGTLWVQEGRGAFLEAQVDNCAFGLVRLPIEGGYIPAHVPGTLGICQPGPSKSPPLPARWASTGKGCTGRQTRRKRPLTLTIPRMTGQRPPFQAHLLSVQAPGPPHQSHKAKPPLSLALPTVADLSVPPGGLSSLPEGSMWPP